MANLDILRAALNAAIYQNYNNEISGSTLNTILNSMVDAIGGGYQFRGVATPETDPGTPDPNVFYIAAQVGTYSNFGLSVGENEVALFLWDGIWRKQNTGAASAEVVSQLGQEVSYSTEQSISASPSGWQNIDYVAYPEYEYRVTKKTASGSLLYFYGYKNGTQVAVTGFVPLVDEGDSCLVKFASETDQIRVFGDGSTHFEIANSRNVIERDLDNLRAIISQNDSIKEALSKSEQYAEFYSSDNWRIYTYPIFKGNSYVLKNVGSNTLDYFQVLDADDQNVPVTGFTALSPGSSCTISTNVDGAKIKIFSSGSTTLAIKNNIDLIANSNIHNSKINELEGDVTELERGGKVFSFTSSWQPYTDFIFYKGLEYTLYQEGGAGTIILLEVRKGTSIVSTTGFSAIGLGQSCVIKTNGDADNFRIYSDGGSSKLRISEQKVDYYGDVRALKNLPESYSLKDSIVNRVIVAKDGSGDYTTIADAFSAITDSSYINQYEVVVYPGVYNEINLVIPPFTHLHGCAPNSVTITSEGLEVGTLYPVIEQQKSCTKISNLTIISHNGYCVHFDEQLSNRVIVNENLILIKAVNNSSAIIGGGTFLFGTKYIWKNCNFISKVGSNHGVSCHTAGNDVSGNTHLIYDGCSFTDCIPYIGSIGGSGYYVCELINCNFPIGNRGLSNWYSHIRNLNDPSLYRFKMNEWQIIGGGNKNLSMWQTLAGKTIGLKADYPITISGSAAGVIFGANPYVNNTKTARLDCSIVSEYYIDDTQAGYPPNTELRDVYQLWKRLGDCSGTNKTLSVTVNGVTKTYTFTEDYLTSKPAQATIIAAMQAVLDNVTIDAITDSGYGYENVNTSDCLMVKVTSPDIIKGELITRTGAVATSVTNPKDIIGFACEDKPIGEYVKVWTSAFRFDDDYSDGEYGLDSNGALSASAETKIGFVANNIFYLY